MVGAALIHPPMNHLPPSGPLVFVLTPRLGALNHRYLVSAAASPDEHDVQAAFECRSRADDVLAVKLDVPQMHGRTGEEWLIVRDPRIRSLPVARRSAILELMGTRLAVLVPPEASEAATSSGCVPFAHIDTLAAEVETELGRRNRPPNQTRSTLLMPLGVFATAALVAGGVWLLVMPDSGNQQPVRKSPPDVQNLIAKLGGGTATEGDVVASIREKIAPDLPLDATLLQALNYLRRLIKQASPDRYDSVADALKDERMLAAIGVTLSTSSVDAFLDDDGRAALRGLDPVKFRELEDLIVNWPAFELVGERQPYLDIAAGLRKACQDAKSIRSADEPRVKGVFVYHDALTRGPNLLALFVSGREGPLTPLGQMVSARVRQTPATLADWLDAAARAHESTGSDAHLWLSREALTMHRRQAKGLDSESPGAAKFYEQLDRFLVACRAAVRTTAPVPTAPQPTTTPPPRPDAAVPPQPR